MAIKSKVSLTTSGSGYKSLRTVLPMGIADYLGVKAGDYICWNMAEENDTRIIMIRTEQHQKMEEEFESKSERRRKKKNG